MDKDYGYLLICLNRELKDIHRLCLEQRWGLGEEMMDEVIRLAIELKVELCRRQER